MPFTFSKKERLKSKKQIEALFNEGRSVTAFPLKMIYLETEHDDGVKIKAGVSVSKRLHKNAVDRNKIKRLLREAYRLNKAEYFNNSTTSYAFMILYLSKDGTTFDAVDTAMKTLFKKFMTTTSES